MLVFWGGKGEHRPQRPTERSDPTQHAKGRTGDCPGPRKGATTRRNVRRGGGQTVGALVHTPPESVQHCPAPRGRYMRRKSNGWCGAERAGRRGGADLKSVPTDSMLCFVVFWKPRLSDQPFGCWLFAVVCGSACHPPPLLIPPPQWGGPSLGPKSTGNTVRRRHRTQFFLRWHWNWGWGGLHLGTPPPLWGKTGLTQGGDYKGGGGGGVCLTEAARPANSAKLHLCFTPRVHSRMAQKFLENSDMTATDEHKPTPPPPLLLPPTRPVTADC